jgi:hypothetical protein
MIDHPQRARLGLGLITAAAVGATLLIPPDLSGFGRLLLIILLCLLAARGRRWASIVLSIFVVVRILATIVGVAQVPSATSRTYLFILDAILYAAGLALFLVSGGSRACAPSTSSPTTAVASYHCAVCLRR